MKIFIQEKYLEFVKAGTEIPKSDSTLYIRFDGSDTLVASFAELEKDEAIKRLVVGCDDPEAEFDRFKKTFKLFEAAGGLVKNDMHQYLLIFRRGKWDLPKGKIDKGETVKDAAVREVKEECGITDLSIGDEIQSTYHIYEEKGTKILKYTHWFQMHCSDVKTPVPQVAEGITEVKWMTKEEALNAFQQSYGSIKDMALKELPKF